MLQKVLQNLKNVARSIATFQKYYNAYYKISKYCNKYCKFQKYYNDIGTPPDYYYYINISF